MRHARRDPIGIWLLVFAGLAIVALTQATAVMALASRLLSIF